MSKMVLSDDAEDPVFVKHQKLAKDLNMDEEKATEAWNGYKTIRSKYSLEGNEMHSLACAIFVACFGKPIAVGSPTSVLKKNAVDLTTLLRLCNLSLQQFFNKIAKWAEMADLHDDLDFQQKIKRLEDSFVVTCNIYKEYYLMFTKIFKTPEYTMSKPLKHKHKSEYTKVFEFTWLLFVTVKGKHPKCSKEVMTSYYFMQACLDLAFKNAFVADRRDLLNPNFSGLPENWSLPGYEVPPEAPCVIETLCDVNMLTDAMYVKQYLMTNYLTILFNENIILGDKTKFTDIFKPANFDTSFTNVTKTYEQYILYMGEFDERIFIGDPTNCKYGGEDNEDISSCPDTPLTGKKYVGPKDQNETSLLSTVTQSISTLQNLLDGCTTEPSDTLSNIFSSCEPDPTDKIKEITDRMGSKFLDNLNKTKDVTIPPTEQDKKKLDLAIALFYKLLENILVNEKVINKDICPLLQKSIFFECLFPCSLEIVLYTYNMQKTFPWILDVLEVAPSNFVRVVELIVRSKDQLSRDTVKHLSCVEESILESLMWKSQSILWEDIKNWGEEIPRFEEIALPNRKQSSNAGLTKSPGPSAAETFQSPISNAQRKQLFHTIRPGQSLLANSRPTHLMFTGQDGVKKIIPIEPSQIMQSPLPPAAEPTKPMKTGSLCIILRKFYILAWVRMEQLCNKLCIQVIELKRKIWTVFEHSVRYTRLMRDRHLDQLLMCAVYVTCKVTGNSATNFSEIMKCYREQPQANSNIYRNVLIRVHERSNLIDFYNSVYIQAMKGFIIKFTNTQMVDDLDLLLSPLPAVQLLVSSPRRQVTQNFYIKPLESPNNVNNVNGNFKSYKFSRSAAKDLNDINEAINGEDNVRKRLLTDDSGVPSKRVNRKVQNLIQERKVQNMD